MEKEKIDEKPIHASDAHGVYDIFYKKIPANQGLRRDRIYLCPMLLANQDQLQLFVVAGSMSEHDLPVVVI